MSYTPSGPIEPLRTGESYEMFVWPRELAGSLVTILPRSRSGSACPESIGKSPISGANLNPPSRLNARLEVYDRS